MTQKPELSPNSSLCSRSGFIIIIITLEKSQAKKEEQRFALRWLKHQTRASPLLLSSSSLPFLSSPLPHHRHQTQLLQCLHQVPKAGGAISYRFPWERLQLTLHRGHLGVLQLTLECLHRAQSGIDFHGTTSFVGLPSESGMRGCSRRKKAPPRALQCTKDLSGCSQCFSKCTCLLQCLILPPCSEPCFCLS